MTSNERPALLVGETAEKVHAAIDRASALLVSVPASAIDDGSYATGAAGIAIAHAHLHALFPERGHGGRAEQLMDRSLMLASGKNVAPWLVQGAAGVAWARSYLTGERAVGTDALDEKLSRFVRRTEDLPAELFHGLGGLLVYASTRPGPLAELVVERIVGSQVEEGARGSWVSRPRSPSQPQTPFVDLGFAHGVPGIAAVLACRAGGARRQDALAAVKRAVDYLDAERLPDSSLSAYTSFSVRREPARTAYCYGDPGVAWGLTLAAEALASETIRELAKAIALRTGARRDKDARVDDAGFCHGAAGLGHLLHRLYRRHHDDRMAEAARFWFEKAIEMPGSNGLPFLLETARRGDSRGTVLGLLGGVAGIALALATALGVIDASWDEPLLVAAD